MAESQHIRLSRWGISIALTVLSACSSLGGGRPPEVTVEVNDAGYQPDTVHIAAGKTIKLTLKNSDSVEHQLGISEIPLATQGGRMAEHSMAGMDGAMSQEMDPLQVHLVAASGATASLELTPTKAGEYVFRCVVSGHTEQGTLVVTR